MDRSEVTMRTFSTLATLFLGLALSAVIASAALAEPPDRSSSKSDVFEFVGFSTAAVTGDIGYTGMAATCQADFPESRICIVTEYFFSPTIASPNGEAWLSTPDLNSGTNCDFWSTSNANTKVLTDVNGTSVPITVITSNKFGIDVGCNNVYRVTCCARQ